MRLKTAEIAQHMREEKMEAWIKSEVFNIVKMSSMYPSPIFYTLAEEILVKIEMFM